MSHWMFSSESVSNGHPDKIADQISDGILDAILSQDKHARVACETLVKTGMVLIGGEITTSAWVDMDAIARSVIKDIGYTHSDMGFDWESCAVLTAIGKQSADIAKGVDGSNHLGAGDQGLMFGYACGETSSLMPAGIHYANQLMQAHQALRGKPGFEWIRPDAKCQLTLSYEDHQPTGIEAVVFSTQHAPEVSQETISEVIREELIQANLPKDWLTSKTQYLINPTGRFVVGGPLGDCGLTGRKIIVDTYGGYAHHGGGAFSGKDPTKVDRSGAYMARYIAKNLVAGGVCERAQVQLAYAIGHEQPVSVSINDYGTAKLPNHVLVDMVKKEFDLTPKGMIEQLDLLNQTYLPVAAHGHFGREDLDLPWERTDQAASLAQPYLGTA